MPKTLMTMVGIVIGILILLPLVVRVQRLQARGVITDERPLDRVIRERITSEPARLTPPDYRHSRRRYYRIVFHTVPFAAVGLAVIIAVLAKPHNPLGLIMAPACLSGLLVLAISEDRFIGVSRRQRITCASLSGLLAAIAALVIISGVDPHAVLASTGG
jgi:hypothetical protein